MDMHEGLAGNAFDEERLRDSESGVGKKPEK